MHRRSPLSRLALCTAALLCSSAVPALGQQTPELKSAIQADYAAVLKPLFEHFHRNPELSFRESATAARMAEELRALGLEVTEGVGQTGVVGVLKNGEGPTVLVRADMDGLPVREMSGLPYASKARQVDVDGVEKPVMHACGHDVHITSLIGTARQLIAQSDNWSGTVVFVVQPAEEIISGARAMIEDGLYTRFPKPDYALAFHVGAQIPTGKLTVKGGPVYSSSDSVDVTIRGVGAHGAAPHQGIDPILIASQFVVSLQSLVSRTISPLDAGVVTVGAIHGGIKHNIIPNEVKLQLTVRSDKPEVRAQLLDGIERIARGVAETYGTPEELMPTVAISGGKQTPPTKNDEGLAQQVRSTFGGHFGTDVFYDQPRTGMGAEDFAYFVAPEHGVKGVYFGVGGTPEKDLPKAASHHSPFFKVAAEPAVTLGTEAMVVAAMSLMPKEAK